MSWTNKLSRTSKIVYGLIIGASSVGGITWLVSDNREHYSGVARPNLEKPSIHLPLNKVLASWTTNFTPAARWDDDWDRMQPASLVKPDKKKAVHIGDGDQEEEKSTAARPTASRHLLLIRHGQYVLNSKDDASRHLTELGTDQACVTGERLRTLRLPYTSLVHSSMLRARQTSAEIEKCLPDVPVSQCDLLREGAPIPPEPPVGNWKPEAEFFKDGARIEAAFRKYFHRAPVSQKEDSYEVIVCHANVIRYFVCRGLQFPPEGWLRLSLNNGSITWMTIRPNGRVSLRALSDAGHFKPALLTTT